MALSQKLQHYWNLTIRLFCVLTDTHWGGGSFTPLKRYSWCILQPQLTGQIIFCSIIYIIQSQLRRWWKRFCFRIFFLQNHISQNPMSSSSSSCAIRTDIPDPLSSPFPIIHCFRQFLWATFRIGTKLLNVGSSWSSCLCSSMWRGLQEYITDELVPTSPAWSRSVV